jgi:hypothetical protein
VDKLALLPTVARETKWTFLTLEFGQTQQSEPIAAR